MFEWVLKALIILVLFVVAIEAIALSGLNPKLGSFIAGLLVFAATFFTMMPMRKNRRRR